jgi:tRNA pseudouridine38-40 synthase
MARYFLRINFNGTEFHGWQSQINAHSVQAEVMGAMQKVLKDKLISILGCGRTDAGVHATEFYLHFDHASENLETDDQVFFKLNRCFPHSIGLLGIKKVNDRAHARYDATSRTYEYHMHFEKNPFLVNRSWYSWVPLDVDKMNECAKEIIQTADFAAFQKSGAGSKTSLCTVTKSVWEKTDNGIRYTVTANRFLRNMVRALVGTFVEVGKGKMSKHEFLSVFHSKDRRQAGESVPAGGLYLVKVEYPYPVK